MKMTRIIDERTTVKKKRIPPSRRDLVQDIKSIFQAKNVSTLRSVRLLKLLLKMPKSPWSDFNDGGPLTARQMNSFLNPYRIHSQNIWSKMRKESFKGFKREWFDDIPV